MGKAKQRTELFEQLMQAVRHYSVAKQLQQAIEQHNFDKLVVQGMIVEGSSEKGLDPPMAGGG